MRKKKILTGLLSLAIVALTAAAVWGQSTGAKLKHGSEGSKDTSPKLALAYVEDFRKGTPDPRMFTHLIYSFLKINDTNDGIVIRYPKKLQSLVDLKKENPDLKVMVSIGGDKAGGFSEMAGNKKKRKAFVKELSHLVDSLGLDGVDLDWEFPTLAIGGKAANKKDDKNYALLAKEIREAIGKDKWISYYSNNSGKWIDHKKMMPYVDYVHVSGYNLAVPKEGQRGLHQSQLYPSKKLGDWCVSKSIERHIDLGVPKEKILMGIPFFGRGKKPFPSYVDCQQIAKNEGNLKPKWDNEAQAPYYADEKGDLVLGYDDERSIAAKFDFIRANGLDGVFIWNYDSDYDDHRLGKTIQRLRK